MGRRLGLVWSKWRLARRHPGNNIDDRHHAGHREDLRWGSLIHSASLGSILDSQRFTGGVFFSSSLVLDTVGVAADCTAVLTVALRLPCVPAGVCDSSVRVVDRLQIIRSATDGCHEELTNCP
jgi:hypothetical protein